MPIIDIAEKFLESPYEFGGNGSQPGEKMDSSRFVQIVMKELGRNISRITKVQCNEGQNVNINDMIIGDCIYFDYGKGI